MQVPSRSFHGVHISRAFDSLRLIAWNTFSSLSLSNSKSHSLPLITMEEIYWQHLILISMCFSHGLKCCLCTAIIKSSLFLLLLCHQMQNLVTDTDEWSPCFPGHSLTGLILLRLFLTDWEGEKNWLVPLRIQQFCFLSTGLQAIPLCAVPFPYYCATRLFFDTSVELLSQPRKWQVNFTFQLSKHFGRLGGRWGSNEQRANRRSTDQ